MKIIVAYASAGAGHFKAAEAIYNYLKKSCPQNELKLVDALDYSLPLFAFFYRWGYSFLIRRAPFLWQIAFFLTSFVPTRFITRSIASCLNKINSTGFSRFLLGESAGVIISTHFLPSEIAAGLKTKGRINSRLITQVTDFKVHPFWVSAGTDIYFVASAMAVEQLKKAGVKNECIRFCGIPVDEKFLRVYDKAGLREKLGIDKGMFTVLAMTGSFGSGPLEKIALLLHDEVGLLIVCANNKKLYARLVKRNLKNVKVFAFIDNQQELMAASDLIITKPGGLSTSESLAMGLFPVFISPIPGQETGNIEALALEGVGVYPKSLDNLKRIVLDFKQQPQKLEGLRQLAVKMKKPECLTEICDAVCQCSAGIAC